MRAHVLKFYFLICSLLLLFVTAPDAFFLFFYLPVTKQPMLRLYIPNAAHCKETILRNSLNNW